MVNFVGAGPGAKDLVTVRAQRLLSTAGVIIYTGSLINPELLEYAKPGCQFYNSARMTLEEVIDVIKDAHNNRTEIVRLHTGDPSIYGAIKEQMDKLDELGIPYASCPGVSSFCGAAASLNLEYTLPGISQSVIITRMEGRTPVPTTESIESFAAHNATMVLFLSAGMAGSLSQKLISGGYSPDTPAAIVYKATWADEEKYICTIGTLEETAQKHNISKTALIIIGNIIVPGGYNRSELYNPCFSTEYRESSQEIS